MVLTSLCVFCGSRSGNDPAFETVARALGTLLGQRSVRLVYGGARIGTMGAVADAALAAGGEVLGVIPQAIADVEVAHEGLTELHVVGSMHERKALMAAHADAFLALPGGLGTLEELFEVWTWSQLGIHRKPLGVLNLNGYYDALAALLEHMIAQGFVRREHAALLHTATTPELALRALEQAAAEPVTGSLRDKLDP
ncbi:MAG: TIGR00730 family Rossman fold protein [Pseudomonadota bacterium]